MDIKIPELYAPMFHNKNGVTKYPNDVLRTVATTIESNENVSKIITKMSDALRITKGVGLAANQIGISKRIIMVRQNQRYALLNPVIVEASGTYIAEEGCLSIPGLWGKVSRHQTVTVKGISPHGKEVVLTLTDMDAVIPQHEIDHLDGIMFFDKAIQDSLHWFSVNVGTLLPAEFSNSD